ncbi:MAG: sialidase family protein [Actinomycetes bacterium]
MRRVLLILAPLLLAGTGVAAAAGYTPGVIVPASPLVSPLASCTILDTGPGVKYLNTEVEPSLAINPTRSSNVVGSWQQDRWSSGAAAGAGFGVSFDGGASFTDGFIPGLTKCSDGTDFSRASDPWLTFAPDGTLYQMSLVETKLASGGNTPTGMSVSRSPDGGLSWEPPTFIAYDTDTSLFNDKNSITADPTNANYVYAIWDRLDSPPGKGSLKSSENTSGYRGPTLLARTTDGGDTWGPARIIFNLGTHNQTIGNQIVVLPDGTLVNLFDLIRNDSKGKIRGYNVAVIRSSDKGVTWDTSATVVSDLQFVQVRDPDTGALVRTGDIIPEVAVDRTTGNLYAVWQDGRWSGGTHANIAFSQSTDGGLHWSTPVKIDGAPTGVDAFTPSIAVAADGTVGVAYYDFRDNTSAAGLPTSYWFTSCTSSCTSSNSWLETHVDGPFNMENAPVARGYFLGDYEGIATAGNDFGLLYARSGSSANTSDVVYTRLAP